MDKPDMKISSGCNCGGSCSTQKEMGKEELTGMLHQLSEQSKNLFNENKQLRQVIDEMNMTNLFKRLDYLFKVITEDNKYLSPDFKSKCAKEIELLMTQPEEPSEE